MNNSILPIISMSDLQRAAKEKLGGLKDYAVIQRHGKDVAFVLHPKLGRILLESGLLEEMKRHGALDEGKNSESKNSSEKMPTGGQAPSEPPEFSAQSSKPEQTSGTAELDRLIGTVITELSKR